MLTSCEDICWNPNPNPMEPIKRVAFSKPFPPHFFSLYPYLNTEPILYRNWSSAYQKQIQQLPSVFNAIVMQSAKKVTHSQALKRQRDSFLCVHRTVCLYTQTRQKRLVEKLNEHGIGIRFGWCQFFSLCRIIRRDSCDYQTALQI